MTRIGNEQVERLEAADFPYVLRGKDGAVVEQGMMQCYRVISTGGLVWVVDNPDFRVKGAEFLCGQGVASLLPADEPELAPEVSLETPENKAPKTHRKG